jgi:hypothetical protein
VLCAVVVGLVVGFKSAHYGNMLRVMKYVDDRDSAVAG